MKYKTKRFLKNIALVLVGVLACGALFHLTGNDIDLKKDSDVKNLIDNSAEEYIISQEPGYGVTVDVDEDDGEITLKGTATSSYELKVTEVTLAPGTYKISGLDKCTVNGFNMHVKSGSDIIAYSGIEDLKSNTVTEVFELSEETTVTVWIVWENDHNFGVVLGTQILPVISEVK